MKTLIIFYVISPLLAILAGLLSKFNNRILTTVFNLLMLLVILAGAIYTIHGHHGWIHILSFIALTILGNLAGVVAVGRWKR